MLNKNLMYDGFPLYFISSAAAGFMAILIGLPFDVIKSTLMDGK